MGVCFEKKTNFMIFVLALALPSPAAGGSDRSLDLLRLWLHRRNSRPSMVELEEELFAVARLVRMPWSRPSCTLLSDQSEVVCSGASLCRMWNHKSFRIIPSLRSSWSVCDSQLQPTNSGRGRQTENETRAATMQEYEPGRTVFKKEKKCRKRKTLYGETRDILRRMQIPRRTKIAAQRVFLQHVRQQYEKQKSRDGLYHSF